MTQLNSVKYLPFTSTTRLKHFQSSHHNDGVSKSKLRNFKLRHVTDSNSPSTKKLITYEIQCQYLARVIFIQKHYIQARDYNMNWTLKIRRPCRGEGEWINLDKTEMCSAEQNLVSVRAFTKNTVTLGRNLIHQVSRPLVGQVLTLKSYVITNVWFTAVTKNKWPIAFKRAWKSWTASKWVKINCQYVSCVTFKSCQNSK